jgi:peptide-methionine (S)-S-oxide reductase
MTILETAYFGGGCFWGVEQAFRLLPGVVRTQVGFMGGMLKNPSYEAVCGGLTHHAEVVAVCFNAGIISYSQLLTAFWLLHNPTQLNRQGVDVGSQYRSIIFTTTESQLKQAMDSKQQCQSYYAQTPVVTEIITSPAPAFWPAEAYHQQYFEKHPQRNNCHLVDETVFVQQVLHGTAAVSYAS